MHQLDLKGRKKKGRHRGARRSSRACGKVKDAPYIAEQGSSGRALLHGDRKGRGDSAQAPERPAGNDDRLRAQDRGNQLRFHRQASGELFFLLIGSEENTGEHLKLLSRLARFSTDDEFIAGLLNAEDPEEVSRRHPEGRGVLIHGYPIQMEHRPDRAYHAYLFVGWLLFSWSFAPFSLVTGAVFSFSPACSHLPPFHRRKRGQRRALLPRLHYLVYYLLLLGFRLYVSSFKVLYNVLLGRINPGIVHFRTRLKSDVARVILTNSITLTPGTITLDLKDDHLVVHWLDAKTSHSGYAEN
jgi:multicomponent Na+:H+ antiporter subunit E